MLVDLAVCMLACFFWIYTGRPNTHVTSEMDDKEKSIDDGSKTKTEKVV